MTAENIDARILFIKEKEHNFKRRTYETSKTMHEKQDPNIPDLQANWPKIVEYAGLSEYEAKVYLMSWSLIRGRLRGMSGSIFWIRFRRM